jgi:Tfp pilus assembly protein PilN
LNNQKQQLLQMLEQTANEPRPQFFLVMRDLAAADRSGFWLTQFRLGAQEIRFHGVTRDARQLPGWLQQLGQNPYLRQRSFARVQLEPASGPFLQFEVSSNNGSTP